jgi:hypothetical protein
MDFPDPEAQSLFRKCREKAMATGDRQSVEQWHTFRAGCLWTTNSSLKKGATASVIVLASGLAKEGIS